MAGSLTEFREKISEIVRAHYEKTHTPFLLSRLGLEVEKQKLWPDERGQRNLKQLISETCEPDLQLVRDPRAPAYIAVVTPDVRQAVEEQIAKRSAIQSSAQVRLEDLARPILLAFCIDVQNQPIYVRRVRPFRYEVGMVTPDRTSEYILVDPEFRRPGLRIDSLQQLSAADKIDLENRIQRWAIAHNIDLRQFVWAEEPAKSLTDDSRTALDRLLAAQPQDVAARMLIPADIAQILTKLR